MSKTDTTSAPRGALGGAAAEAGSEFRASVAAWAVAFGLAGRPLPLVDLPQDESSVPVGLRLETDAPVDDIQVDLKGGGRVFIQAKSRLSFRKRDPDLRSALTQCVRAVRESSFDSQRDRLVLVVGKTTKGLGSLFLALQRAKHQLAGRPTANEQRALNLLDELTPQLNATERAALRAVACGFGFGNESALTAQSALAAGVVQPADAARAFRELKTIARDLAVHRLGLRIDEWADRLTRSKIKLVSNPDGTSAARWEARRLATRRYRADLVHRGTSLDLRSLGAALPPLRHRMSRLSMQVTAPTRSRKDSEVALDVAARRRPRVLLLGLPGSGKSTALRHLAAEWARDPGAPLPFIVNLRQLSQLLPYEHPFDAIVQAALLNVRSIDRPLVEEEFRERARDGRLALLLDALDESREARFDVVQAIERVLREINKDATVVLATRDSGYAAASTLPLEPLRLKPIRTPDYTLLQILKAFAAKRSEDELPSSVWIQERLSWIRATLDRDRTLAETPLGGILLAILAAEPHRHVLPQGRAKTLSAVVDGVVERWELTQRQRASQLHLGGLDGVQAAAALRESFAQIGYLLLSHPLMGARDVKRELASWLKTRWGRSDGAADVTAHEIFGFWDEAGVFMASEASETVSARLQLLAEIGAARYIVGLPADAMRTELEQFAANEPLFEVASLSAGLSDEASKILVSFCVSRGQLKWDLMAAKHLREGSALEESATRVACALAAHVKLDDAGDRWGAAKTIAMMPIPLQLRLDLLLEFNNLLSSEYCCLALAMSRAADGLEIEQPEAALSAARTLLRPKTESRSFFGDPEDDEIADLIVYITEHSLPHRPDLGSLLLEAAHHGSSNLWDRLDGVLLRVGRADLAAAKRQKYVETWEQMRESSDAMDRDWRRFLMLIGELAPERPLSFAGSWRLDELADFIATLRVCSSEAGAVSSAFHRRQEDVESIIRLAADLGGFDAGLLSAEAKVVLSLEDRGGRALLLLCDAATKREMRHWKDEVVERSLGSLIDLLGSTRWIGRIAAEALAYCPHPDASTRIEAVFSNIRSINRLHAGEAVIALGQNVATRAADWQRSPDPFMRQLGAWWFARNHSDESLDEHCESALSDPDRGVRVAAIRGFRGRPLSGPIRQRVESLLLEPETGYVCMHCGTANPSDVTSCTHCNLVGPEPQRETHSLFKQDSDLDDDEDD